MGLEAVLRTPIRSMRDLTGAGYRFPLGSSFEPAARKTVSISKLLVNTTVGQ